MKNLGPHSTHAQVTWVFSVSVTEEGARERSREFLPIDGGTVGGSVVGRGSVFGLRPGQTLRQNQVTLSHIHLSASVRLPALVQRELSFGRRWGNQQIHSAGGVQKNKKVKK